MTDWADEIARSLIGESYQDADAAIIRKVRADGIRQAADIVKLANDYAGTLYENEPEPFRSLGCALAKLWRGIDTEIRALADKIEAVD